VLPSHIAICDKHYSQGVELQIGGRWRQNYGFLYLLSE
jgi:hypothetical protein